MVMLKRDSQKKLLVFQTGILVKLTAGAKYKGNGHWALQKYKLFIYFSFVFWVG